MTADDIQGRRAHERVRLSLEVAYRSTGSFLVSYTVDLSRGGLFLETEQPRSVGSELELRLAIPGANDEVLLTGEVVWIQQEPAPGKPMGMGVRFTDLERSFGDVIDGLVKTFSGLRVLVISGAPRTRAKLVRILRSALAAQYIDADPAKPLPPEAESGVDLWLVDLQDGSNAAARALLERLLADGAPTAVVAMSSHPRARAEAHDLGAHEVVGSPPGSNEIRAAVLRALGRPMLRNTDSEDE